MIERGDTVGMRSPLFQDMRGEAIGIREDTPRIIYVRWAPIYGIIPPAVGFGTAEHELRLIATRAQAA